MKWILEGLLISSRLYMFFGVFSWWLCTFFFFWYKWFRVNISNFWSSPSHFHCLLWIHPSLSQMCCHNSHDNKPNQFSLHPPTSCDVLLCASLYSFPSSFSFVAHFSQSPSIEPYSHIGSFSTAHELSDLKHMLVRLQVTEYLIGVSHKIDDQN